MNIKVYSTPSCPYCYALKAYLKDNGFDFEDIDVSLSKEKAKEMIIKSGQMGVPVADIDGNIVVGFDREKIDALLGLNKK